MSSSGDPLSPLALFESMILKQLKDLDNGIPIVLFQVEWLGVGSHKKEQEQLLKLSQGGAFEDIKTWTQSS